MRPPLLVNARPCNDGGRRYNLVSCLYPFGPEPTESSDFGSNRWPFPTDWLGAGHFRCAALRATAGYFLHPCTAVGW